MVSTARIFPIPHFSFKGGLVDPQMRASNEHLLILQLLQRGQADRPSLRASSDHRFIVGALRARRTAGYPLPMLPDASPRPAA
jgi:hypothetical protein